MPLLDPRCREADHVSVAIRRNEVDLPVARHVLGRDLPLKQTPPVSESTRQAGAKVGLS